MSVCDKINDRDLALVTSALRKLTTALDQAGMNAAMHLTSAETDACVMLSGFFSAEPLEIDDGNGCGRSSS